jgi:hypothetical protein
VKILIVLLLLPLIGIAVLVFLTMVEAWFLPPQSFHSELWSDTVLTNSRKAAIGKGKVLNVFFDENIGGARIYGWKGQRLYFSDENGRNWAYDARTGEKAEVDSSYRDLIFERQDLLQRCDDSYYQKPTDPPTIEMLRNDWQYYCYQVNQGGTVLRVVPFGTAFGGEVFDKRVRFYFEKAGKTVAVQGKWCLQDLPALSPDGDWVALDASEANPSACADNFSDIHVLKLKIF